VQDYRNASTPLSGYKTRGMIWRSLLHLISDSSDVTPADNCAARRFHRLTHSLRIPLPKTAFPATGSSPGRTTRQRYSTHSSVDLDAVGICHARSLFPPVFRILPSVPDELLAANQVTLHDQHVIDDIQILSISLASQELITTPARHHGSDQCRVRFRCRQAS